MEKENSELKPVKLRLKIDLVSYPTRAEGLVNMYTVALYLFIICLDYVLRKSIDLIKEKQKEYPAETKIDADNAKDLALLENSSTQAESLLYSLEREPGDVGLHVNAKMRLKQEEMISTLSGKP